LINGLSFSGTEKGNKIMVNMNPITNRVGTPVKTGVVINTSNFQHPFANALNNAVSNTAGAYAPSSAKPSVPNTSLKWHTSVAERNEMMQSMSYAEKSQYMRELGDEIDARTLGTWKIPLGRGELLGLMQAVEAKIAEGEHPMFALTTALLQQKAKHTRPDEGILGPGSGCVDFLYICVSTGQVKHADGRVGMNTGGCKNIFSNAEDSVWDLAYDFQKFMQLRIFGNTGDMTEEEIEAEIADIFGRQSEKCLARWIDIPEGKLCDCCIHDEEEQEPDEQGELIDGFIQAIGDHQDELYEEYIRLKGQSQYQYKHVNGEVELTHSYR
jgi:hypothetical protein